MKLLPEDGAPSSQTLEGVGGLLCLRKIMLRFSSAQMVRVGNTIRDLERLAFLQLCAS